MRRGLSRLAIVVASMALVSGGIATAAPMEPINDDWGYWEKVRVAYPDLWASNRPYVGAAFWDRNPYFGSSLQGMVQDPNFPELSRGVECNSPDSAPCDAAKMLSVYGALPACTQTRVINCVEGVYSRNGGEIEDAAFAGEWLDNGRPPFAEIPVTNGTPVPASGRTPLWSLPRTPHSAGTLYLVAASIATTLDRRELSDGWTRTQTTLSAEIVAVERVPWDSGSPCLTSSEAECLVKKRLPDTSLGLKLRVAPDLGAFIFGRVLDPEIDIQPGDQGITLQVEGRPAITPQATVVTEIQDAPPFVPPWDLETKGGLLTVVNAGVGGSLETWRSWGPYLGPRSDALLRIWGFRSSSAAFSGLEQCVTPGEVAGWISTNSMVFEASPPVYDGTQQSLDFKVGGPPETPTGGLANADYDLHLRESVAQCIWPSQDLAVRATVSVLNGAGGEQVTTTAVGVADGWVKFIARNIIFPDVPAVAPRSTEVKAVTPTIRVAVMPQSKVKRYASCTAMRKAHRDGVMRPGAENVIVVKGKRVKRPALGSPVVSAAIYSRNSRLDKDRDGLACEREPRVR